MRYRSTEKSQSAMERYGIDKLAFLEAYREKGRRDLYTGFPSLVTELYEKLNNYMVTNIGTDQFVQIFKKFFHSMKIDKCGRRLPGEGVSGSQEFDESPCQ